VPTTGNPIHAVLFDFAGTLFAPQTAVRQVELAAHELHLVLTPAECARLGQQLLRAGMPGGPYPDSVPDELAAIYAKRDLSPDAHRAAYVALMSTVAAPAGLAAAVYDRIRRADGWVAYSDTPETIHVLSDRGVPMGLVSNVGFDLRPILTAHGFDQLARHATLSFELGVAKPSLEIFQHALADLDVQPENTLMVGDHPADDGGGGALGIRTLILPMSLPGARHGLDRVLALVIRATGLT
jgi:HAD superfamily hydrolase (TIGR01549 family)